jgi:hypothetical protein
VSRTVCIESIQTPYWSTRPLAWGFDVDDGSHVAFALSREHATELVAELQSDGVAYYKVEDTDVLYARASEVLR